MAQNQPLIVFPDPARAERARRGGGPSGLRLPSVERQAIRLTPRFRELEQALDAKRAQLQSQVAGADPEQVLVLEIAGTVDDFIRAVQRVDGLEWLSEVDQEELLADEDFFVEKEDLRRDTLAGQLFLVMTNHQALQELLSLWRRFTEDPTAKFDWGKGRLKQVFERLRDIRRWDVEDRLIQTGALEDWRFRIDQGQTTVPFETELWFRRDAQTRAQASAAVRGLVVSEGGTIVREATISEISYHAILGELPTSSIERVLSAPDTALVRSDDIMFFRPVGQAFEMLAEDDTEAAVPRETASPTGADPLIALLDGLPLENHDLLAGRLFVDDPENWAVDYPADTRQHGTAMASLIGHGELEATLPPLTRPMYVRPIMKPTTGFAGPQEAVPEDELYPDLLTRVVRRIVGANQTPVAPTVRIVNLSVCDRSRPFDWQLSACARAIDSLAWEHGLLFIVSAGNHLDPLELSIATGDVEADDTARQRESIQAVIKSAHLRRLLSPAESVNSLTVGAQQHDSCAEVWSPPRLNPYTVQGLPNPVSAIGMGYRRSVKPDIEAPGGRQLYEPKPGAHPAILNVNAYSQAPGQRVACPGPPGDLSRTRHSRGTSNAAALVSRLAEQVFDAVQEVATNVPNRCWPPILKALLVNASHWDQEAHTAVTEAMPGTEETAVRNMATRLFGFGTIGPDRAVTSTAQRATLIGWGQLGEEDAHIFSLPIPPSLSGSGAWRRLTCTLAWLTPINVAHRKYRRAQMWLSRMGEELHLGREGVDTYTSRRGTVHHVVLSGNQASFVADNSEMSVQVNCSADAGELDQDVPYALVVTLEVAPGLALPIYDEIRERIRPAVPVAAGPGVRQ